MPDDRYSLVIDVDARRGRREVRGLGQDMQRTGGQASRLESGMAKFQSRIVALGGTFAGIQLARKVINIAASFETLRVQLETVEGSAAAAERAFDKIKVFAARTPFQVDNITRAFVQFRAVGLNPTMSDLRAAGDLAAAFGTDITESVNAITRAAFGESEPLKRFGILARVEADKLRITFKGLETVVARDAQAITEHLLNLSRANFGDAMERQAETFNGRVSTMKDALANMADSMAGNGGILDALSQLVLLLTQAAEALNGYVIAQSKAPKGLFLGRPADVDDDYMAQLKAFVAAREELVERHREVIESETGVRGMLTRFENSKIAAPFQALEKALEGISPSLAQVGKDFDALRDAEIFDGAQKVARAFSQTPIFSPGGVKDTGLDPAVLAATAEQFPQIGTGAKKAATSADQLAAALERANQAMGLGSTRAALDEIDKFYQGYLDRVAAAGDFLTIDDLPQRLDTISEGLVPDIDPAVWDAIEEELTQAIIDSGNAFFEWRRLVRDVIGGALDNALASVISGGDWRRAAASAVGDIAGAFGGPAVGALAEKLVVGLLSNTKLPDVSVKLLEAGDVFSMAVREFAAAAGAVRSAMLRLESATGGQLFGSQLSISERTNAAGQTQFHARIGGITGGIADTAEEAARIALDWLAQNFSTAAQAGFFNFEGVSAEIEGALRESVFINFDDMVASLETWNGALNAVATTLGAVTPATDATLERLRQMELAIIRSGLSAERAAPFLGEIARAMDIRRQQIEANTLTELASLMERAGINAGKAAAFRAQAEQKITQLKILELEITARQLGLWTEAWAVIFGQLNAWAANINNFTRAAARIVAPVVSSPIGGGGGGGGSHLTPNQDRLDDFLGSLHFTSPGTPIASRTALNAAIAAMEAAAASNDADAFIAASQQALQLQSALYGSLGMAELIAMIEQLGQFTPEETANPVVEAIGGLGSSISSDLSGLGVDITGALDTVSLAIDQDIGARLIELRDNNRDGMIGIREAQGLMTDATFQLLDIDRNGFLDLAELSSEHARGIFDLLDVNRDGNLTLEELLGTVQNPPPPPPPPIDPITPEEMEDILRTLLERLGERIGRITVNQTGSLSPLLTQISDEIQRPQPRFDPNPPREG